MAVLSEEMSRNADPKLAARGSSGAETQRDTRAVVLSPSDILDTHQWKRPTKLGFISPP